jgi:tRNA/tmRNA/rRNA uracil-C5-methylase (TrmA/RlmC/RlmD family)
MRIGDQITIEAAELVAGGEALARVDGMALFVRNLFPGDVATVRITEAKKGYGRAELVTLLQPSADRRLEPCPVAGECGGCDWTALRLDRQLSWKRHILTESLRRVGKLDPASLPPVTIHPSPLNYRLRSRVHVDPKSGAPGFFATGTHRVVPLVPECEVVSPMAAGALPEIRTDAAAIHAWQIGDLLLLRDDDVPDEDLTLVAGGERWQLSTASFFQVNRHLLTTMLRLVGEHAARVTSRKSAFDLYSGVGFFTSPLARVFDKVTAVEGAGESHRYAKMNAAPNVRLVRASVEHWASAMPKADFIFLDPPRAGAKREVIDAVAKSANEMICFLACDPVTFARDAARLTASGWRLLTLDLLDLFPNTHHIETLSSFVRAG